MLYIMVCVHVLVLCVFVYVCFSLFCCVVCGVLFCVPFHLAMYVDVFARYYSAVICRVFVTVHVFVLMVVLLCVHDVAVFA